MSDLHKAYWIRAEQNRVVLNEREGGYVQRHIFDLAGAKKLRDELDPAIGRAEAAS